MGCETGALMESAHLLGRSWCHGGTLVLIRYDGYSCLAPFGLQPIWLGARSRPACFQDADCHLVPCDLVSLGLGSASLLAALVLLAARLVSGLAAFWVHVADRSDMVTRICAFRKICLMCFCYLWCGEEACVLASRLHMWLLLKGRGPPAKKPPMGCVTIC